MILHDDGLMAGVIRLITEERMNAETATGRILDSYEARLLALDNEYIKERASDFGEVKRRVLDVLGNMQASLQCEGTGHCQRGHNRIVVSEEMTPALTVDLDMEHLMGLVTERGGPTSHGAILARAMGIPAVSGLPGIRSELSCGTEILVNGTTGEVVVWPSEETISQAHATRSGTMRLPQAVAPVPGFRVMANISTIEDARFALAMQAEGVGLYRTEIELIAAKRMLTEDELWERYTAVKQTLPGCPVVFRLFDIGSDKPAAFLDLLRKTTRPLGSGAYACCWTPRTAARTGPGAGATGRGRPTR